MNTFGLRNSRWYLAIRVTAFPGQPLNASGGGKTLLGVEGSRISMADVLPLDLYVLSVTSLCRALSPGLKYRSLETSVLIPVTFLQMW